MLHQYIAIGEELHVVFRGIIGPIPSDYKLYHSDCPEPGVYRDFLQEGIEADCSDHLSYPLDQQPLMPVHLSGLN